MDTVARFSYSVSMNLRIRLSAVLMLALSIASFTTHAETLLIRGGTVIDMTAGGRPLSNAAILIRDGIIEKISRADEVSDPAAEVIDAKGKFIIPGLIDSHVHYNGYMGELFLAHGITTVNDLSGRTEWQNAVRAGLNSGQLRGPRYLYCARVTNASPEEAQQTVARLLQEADCLRFDADAAADLTRAYTTAAEAADTGVIAHSYDALASARNGIDGIEHLEGVALSTIKNADALKAAREFPIEEGHKNPLLYQYMEPDTFDVLIKELVASNVFLNPTLLHEWKGVIDRTAQFEREEIRLLSAPQLQYVPMDERLVSLGQYHWADMGLMVGPDVDVTLFMNNSYTATSRDWGKQLAEGYSKVQEFLRRFVKAGGKLYSGTDTAAASIPGISLHHEMQLLADAGVPNEAVLASSTRWAAEMLHIDDRLGTLVPGKQADLVILGADPLKDIANTSRIEQVILAGKSVDISYHADYSFPYPQLGPVSKHLYHQPPVVKKISPGSTRRSSEAVVTISGENFVPSSVVMLNDKPVTTEWISLTELKAVLGPAETTQPGSYFLGVKTPAPGGGQTKGVEFIIDYRQ